jgi:uncharacterized protein YvpB
MLTACSTPTVKEIPRTQLRLLQDLSRFERTTNGNEVLLLSSPVTAAEFNELIVSWNATCPPGSALKVEARLLRKERVSRFYTLGNWSAEPAARVSIARDADNDASVQTDTLVSRELWNGAQVRLTLRRSGEQWPTVKLAALSFLNTRVALRETEPNRNTWGKTLPVPERSQLGHQGASGWCSPTCVSMVLAYWSQSLARPELDLPVPAVAREVYDRVYRGTGNWVFNTAFAGSFEGMSGVVTRVDSLRAVEDWVARGVPVALSVSFDLLNGKAADVNNGHLIIVVGFTQDGDVVVNDPWPDPKGLKSVRKTFPRAQVIRAWQRSKQTVYVIAPTSLLVGHLEAAR